MKPSIGQYSFQSFFWQARPDGRGLGPVELFSQDGDDLNDLQPGSLESSGAVSHLGSVGDDR